LSPYRSFWIPDEFVRRYERFKDILRREGKSVGEHLRDHIEHYVVVHDPGNPQARITSYVEGGPVDVAIIEGRVREIFRARREVLFRDIVKHCKDDIADVQGALAMAQRVAGWLRGRGVKVWR